MDIAADGQPTLLGYAGEPPQGTPANGPARFTIGGDDHFPFLAAGIPAVDVIDFDYPAWHTAQDDLDRVSPKGLQVVGDVVLAALPDIEKRVASAPAR